jgi:hypothetical protein
MLLTYYSEQKIVYPPLAKGGGGDLTIPVRIPLDPPFPKGDHKRKRKLFFAPRSKKEVHIAYAITPAKAGVQKLLNKLDSGACPGPDPGFAGTTFSGLNGSDCLIRQHWAPQVGVRSRVARPGTSPLLVPAVEVRDDPSTAKTCRPFSAQPRSSLRCRVRCDSSRTCR